jgi:hypothetical protein
MIGAFLASNILKTNNPHRVECLINYKLRLLNSQNETNLYHKIRWLYQDTIDENGGASGGSCYRSGNHKRFWPTETN